MTKGPSRTSARQRPSPNKAVPVGIGFRVHIGWATAVTVRDCPPSPLAIEKLQLSNPDVAESLAPYHAAKGLDEPQRSHVVTRGAQAVRRRALTVLKEVVASRKSEGLSVEAVGVIRGSERSAEDLRSYAANIHLGDADIFRDALSDAADELSIRVVEETIDSFNALRLGKSGAEGADFSLDTKPKPWRSEEKAAALAGLVALRVTTRAKSATKS